MSRRLLLTIPLALAGLAIGSGTVWFQDGEAGANSTLAVAASDPAPDPVRDAARIPAPAEAETKVAFPLVAQPGHQYLLDSAGRPFLVHGDTAWSLIAQLSREKVDLYLDDRRARGFNTILVSLLENQYATNPPANAYGERPFRNEDIFNLVPFGMFADYSTPNEAYFRHADWVLRRAADKGFLVLLSPSYVGCCGDGWYEAMVANGPDRLRQYGEYLGRRYRDFTNILWVHGGDANPPRKELVRAIAEGIREYGARALHTAHTERETAAIEYWRGEPWLQVNTVYTYGPVFAPTLAQHLQPNRMPYFLIESAYENEHDATEQRLRTQAYQAVLSGAGGQIFGNNPIWHFDGPGIYSAPVTWQEALDSRGAQSMTHLRELLASTPWWMLEPDSDLTLLTGGLGSDDDRAVAARATDRSVAIVYVPGSREVSVDLAQLAGPDVAARWYDPANGRFAAVGGSPFPATGPRRFKPQPSNSSGFDDWVLVLESPS